MISLWRYLAQIQVDTHLLIITICLENETAAEPCLREPPQAVIMREIARYRSASEEAGKPYTKGAEWH